ncbi:LuxR C-terminal-related transcriptional regulator [Bradyrhizobium sp. CB1015]|uniref:LuxR C-terminal-related transcriptional regulator n=1 Tax=Bradyrhizobium sp. CB1015 TaxID=2976822 RepID=UPI0021AA4E24|nr:LuxR C-terminal-related transcriptional regulator [Bradyrhizobium sp. CB1015]UWU96073.1 LuxR C-terminal-related transcriptional regulator [Bradyrhizobium sp. CB1015]
MSLHCSANEPISANEHICTSNLRFLSINQLKLFLYSISCILMSSLGLGYMPKDIDGRVEAGSMLDTSAKEGIFKRTRLVIVDRQPIVLQGLKSVLGAQPDFDVVASCSDGTSCIQAIRSLTPDIALLADTLPDLTASEILAIAKTEGLPTRLVFFTDSDTDHDLALAIAAGACDAIAKFAAPDAVLRSLRLMTKRSVFLDQSELSPTAKEADSGKIENRLELLTPRERQIVRLVSEGMSNKEIAHQLNVSNGTVKVHLHNIFQKLEITNRTVLATLALLQRPSGFGMLSLALLAVAIADELKASEANAMLPDDDSIGPAVEHAEYEPWKRAILRHVIIAKSDEKPALTHRDVFVEARQISIAASAMEALRSAEQSAGSKSKDYSSVGSSTRDLATPYVRGMNDAQIGGDPTAENLFSRLTPNPTLIHAGYGTFATLTGALIYALNDPHLALLSHEPAKVSLDSFVDITGDNAATKLAAITNADDNHVENSVRGFLAHDSRLASAFVTTENESVAGQGTRGHISDGTDAGIGGYSRDQLMDGNVAESVVHRFPTDSNSTFSGSVFNFASGPSRINLAAFGALAWLHMTAASKSIPPHTVAWIFDSASNETIVYVNATDHVLDIGNRDLLEIHLRGIVSIAESDFFGQPTGAAAAVTLEQLEDTLTSLTATETVLSTDSADTIIGTSESALGTAGVWDILADVGWRTEFAPARTTDESADGGSAHVPPIVLVHAATATAVESSTSKSQRIDAGTGPGIAAAGSASGGNSQHVLEPWPAKEAGPEQTEAGFMPGSDVGDENGHQSTASDPPGRSAKTAETDRVEHGRPVNPTSTKAPEAAEFDESSLATADRGDREGQHAPEQMSARAAGRDVAELKSIPGNRAGNDNAHDSLASEGSSGPAKAAEPGGLDHSNLHASERGSATAARDVAEVKPGNRAGNDNAHDSPASEGSPGPAKTAEPGGLDHSNLHASERGAATAARDVAEVKPGNRAGNDNAHDSPASEGSSGPAKTAEPGGLDHSNLHASERGSATAARDVAEVKPGNHAGNDNAHDSPASDGSSGPAKTVEPGGLDHSNLHASERGSATAATETAEAKAVPGNGVGNDNEHHSWTPADTPGSATMAEPSGVEHSNKWGHLTSAHGPEADESVATAGSADRGSTQHAAEPEPAKAGATTELGETDFIFGNGVGDGANHRAPDASASTAATTAKLADLHHGNSEHNFPSSPADVSAATEIAESSTARGDSAGNGNSQQATQPAAIELAAAQPAKSAFETGGADQERVFRFDSDATPFTLVAAVEPREVHIPLDPNVQHGQATTPDILVTILPNALDEHAANHGNNGPHHATGLAPHDWLI